MENRFLKSLMICVFSLTSCISQENPPEVKTPDQTKFITETVVDGIDIPWGMDFISENEILVTEKKGTLYRVTNGEKAEVSGLPEIYKRGQGGLLDVALHPDYKNNKIIFFTAGVHIEGDEGGNTALYCGELNENSLSNIKLLYKGNPNTKKGQHWGSRIVFDNKGHLFFGIGDRGNRDANPQDLNRDGGKIYRLNLDGSIPEDNPFADQEGALKAVYSYGHRNPQGMTVHPETGEIWENEHGPKGGDEINIIQKGKNYGWPVITYGINYSGTSITDKTSMPGMEQPFYYWVPSIAPSGMAFSSSNVYKRWKGNLFVGSLKFKYLERLVIKRGKVVKREKILNDVGRVRNVKEGPDGYLYLGVEGKGILKLVQQ
ncbi:MAG: PQQ-dependent sugar dehydrogenase [Flavobacteriaceae bacterium]|nr:PQQ-dependent sugar dehydrogenase [Flavobacteriaceae bacterium]